MTAAQDFAGRFETIVDEGDNYLADALALYSQTDNPEISRFGAPERLMKSLPRDFVERVRRIESRITDWAADFGRTLNLSPLTSAADYGDLRINIRKMVAALSFREYQFRDASLMSWEDTVYGVEPARQDESEATPTEAMKLFDSAADKIRHLLLFAKGSEFSDAAPTQRVPAVASGAQQRTDTAFIMMWMSEEHPELVDVKNGIVDVFREFGIEAIRADDIEHEGVITERVLQEIATAEFLIADLTGARPNVYYEIGYAHALGKRVQLYKRKDSALHFDLAGRNVPSYANVSDLKQMLRTRLEHIVGFKSPASRRPVITDRS